MKNQVVLLILLVGLCAPGCRRSKNRGEGVDEVVSIGGMVADARRERVYVSDSGNGRILSLSTRTGNLDASVDLGTELGGLDINGCASLLFVSAPESQRVDTIDLDILAVDSQSEVDSAPANVGQRTDDRVLTVTSEGLVEVDLTDGSETLVTDLVKPDALLTLTRDKSIAYVAQTSSDSVDVLRIEIANPAGAIQAAKLVEDTVDVDVAAGLALSFDEQLVFVGSKPGIQVLDATTLGLIGFCPVAPLELNSFSVNRAGTRGYYSVGLADVQAVNLDVDQFLQNGSFDRGRLVLTQNAVQDRGLLIAADGLSLFTHEADNSIQAYPVFDLRLEGPGIALQGIPYELTIQGDPEDDVLLFGSLGANFNYFQDPDVVTDPLLMDQDPSRRFFVFQGKLDEQGILFFQCSPRDFEDVGEIEVILQAISFNGGLKEISNPLVVQVRFTCDDPLVE